MLKSILQDLNPVQEQAVKAINGPVMIVAGAGSGKTRVLTYRIAHLMNCGVPPNQILALTFTNKAASEMRTRIHQLAGPKAAELWMGTFHSTFARILRREAELLGFSRSFTIYDSDDSLGLVKKSMEKLNISAQMVNPQVVRSRISGAKNQLISYKAYMELARDILEEKVASVYEVYQRTLRANNAMDFDDLLLNPIELFQRHSTVLEEYHHRFAFILVDEFQDTNKAQYEVLKLLARKKKNICVVGDDAQSIYAFRGADIRNILDFAKDYPDCVTFRLEQNYRSTKRILAAADRLIKNNIDQLKKNLWTDNAEGEPVRLLDCFDERDEGHQITQLVQAEILHNKRDLKDFAILYRTNAQSRSIEDALRRRGIPYVIVGGIRFYERKEVKDVLAYLRLLVNPKDEESLLRAINYPSRGIGETTIDRLQQFAQAQTLTLYESLERIEEIAEINERTKRSISQFRSFIDKYQTLRSKMSLSELTRSLVDEMGILKIFKEEATPESLSRWENVQELLSAITEFSAERTEGTLEGFLEEVALVADIDTWEGDRNAVTLMTLHSSKGLEFPVVFITGVEEGLLPFYNTTIERVDLEEERRLFYVGMTRAKSHLFLTKASSRYRFGEATQTSTSTFLSELGEEHLAVAHSPLAKRNGERHISPVFSRPSRAQPSVTRSLADEESHFEDQSIDYGDESQDIPQIRQGLVVQHEIFGRGKVVRVSGRGDLMKATVDFDEAGMKNLILKFARLRLIS